MIRCKMYIYHIGGKIMTRIYLITNLLNGKQYVGKTIHTLSYRFSQHCNNNYYDTYIHNAIKKIWER